MATGEYLGGQVGPLRMAFILNSDRLHSRQDHIFSYFNSQAPHACDEDAGSAHTVHCLMTQNEPVQSKQPSQRHRARGPRSVSFISLLVLTAVESRVLHLYLQSLTCWGGWGGLFEGQLGTPQPNTPKEGPSVTDHFWREVFHFRFRGFFSFVFLPLKRFLSWPLEGDFSSFCFTHSFQQPCKSLWG